MTYYTNTLPHENNSIATQKTQYKYIVQILIRATTLYCQILYYVQRNVTVSPAKYVTSIMSKRRIDESTAPSCSTVHQVPNGECKRKLITPTHSQFPVT